MRHPSLTRPPETDKNPSEARASTHGEFAIRHNINTGNYMAKVIFSSKKAQKKPPYEEVVSSGELVLAATAQSRTPVLRNVLPGIELFSQGATPQISSPLMRFTTEFGMDRSGTTPPWTPVPRVENETAAIYQRKRSFNR